MFMILIISFSVKEEVQEAKFDDLYIDIVVFITKDVRVFLYPTAHMYKEIKSVNVSTNVEATSISIPQKVCIITVYFKDVIKEYHRYAFALLIEIPRFVDFETPFLTGNIRYRLDYTIWINSPGDDIESVPMGLFQEIIEGKRYEREFPRLTVTVPRKFRVEDVIPTEDTRSSGLPYSYGIYQEKRDGGLLIIDTGFFPALRITKSWKLAQNETLTLSFDHWPFLPDQGVTQVIKNTLITPKNVHTIGWFDPPNHIFIESLVEDRNRLISDISTILAILGIGLIPILAYIWNKFRKGKQKRRTPMKKRRPRRPGKR